MKEKKIPMRKCVGCMESKPKGELIRIAGFEGQVCVDTTGRAKGRGVYICPDEACLKTAIKKRAIKRGLQMEITGEQEEALVEELTAKLSENAQKNI